MGNIVGNQVLFPAPPSSYDNDLCGLIWDTQIGTKEPRPFLYIPYPVVEGEPRVPTVIYLHANACDIGGMESELREISRVCGCNVLAPEYPGYGIYQSALNPIETTADGINLVSEHAVELLMTQGVHPSEMIFFGRSIGTGPATRLAKLFRSRGWFPYGLILQSPYVSIHRVVGEYVKIGTWLIGNHWDNKKAFERIGEHVPILIIHGELDDIISVNHGHELYTSCSSRKKHLFCPPLATHNEWDLIRDILKPVRDFIRRYQTRIGSENSSSNISSEPVRACSPVRVMNVDLL